MSSCRPCTRSSPFVTGASTNSVLSIVPLLSAGASANKEQKRLTQAEWALRDKLAYAICNGASTEECNALKIKFDHAVVAASDERVIAAGKRVSAEATSRATFMDLSSMSSYLADLKRASIRAKKEAAIAAATPAASLILAKSFH